jgi:Asp-tRNA(Asn)/Glu-tRNA(Gln) amidotransferase A subunit family amidase
MLTRKEFVTSMVLAAASTALPTGLQTPAAKKPGDDITLDDLKAVEKLAGIEYTDAERKALLEEVKSFRRGYETVRAEPITYMTEPRTVFTPLGGGSLPDSRVRVATTRTSISRQGMSAEQIAFLSLRQLAHLVKTRQITSKDLTTIYLDRLKRYGPPLQCVVTLTEELAMRQAERADREIAAGRYRGPLHGIPYGIKDLFATKGIRTTWGAEPYKDQVPDYDATVVQRLEQAGAVLVAKLTMGALALGDVWFGGVTKNPWNPKQGSSGSSAGSGSATAAGLVGFAIGTETLGSITSPSVRCRVTGLRPTYGRISRFGGMALSYTMDKVGPMCREVEDCALVFAALCGADPKDPSSVSRPFDYRPRRDLRGARIGYVEGKTSIDVSKDPFLENLRRLGAELRPVKFTPVPEGMINILDVECGSAFDEFTRGELIDQLKNSPWPVTFRASRYVPAVEYLQAQRARTLLMERFERELGDLDAYVESGIGSTIVHTNLTGHPQIVIPQGDDGKGNSVARSIIGRLYKEDRLLQIARLAQEGSDFHRQHPRL